MHTVTINENKVHKFEEDGGVVCGRVSREEREGWNVIKLESQKIVKKWHGTGLENIFLQLLIRLRKFFIDEKIRDLGQS